MVATGSRPPYGVKFLPRKSYGVEALILLGCEAAFRGPCLTRVLPLCCFLFVTIWVTSFGSVCEVVLSANLQFYPRIVGSPNGFFRFTASQRPSVVHSCA